MLLAALPAEFAPGAASALSGAALLALLAVLASAFATGAASPFAPALSGAALLLALLLVLLLAAVLVLLAAVVVLFAALLALRSAAAAAYTAASIRQHASAHVIRQYPLAYVSILQHWPPRTRLPVPLPVSAYSRTYAVSRRQ